MIKLEDAVKDMLEQLIQLNRSFREVSQETATATPSPQEAATAKMRRTTVPGDTSTTTRHYKLGVKTKTRTKPAEHYMAGTVRRVLSRSNVNQAMLADALGVSSAAVSRWKSGKSIPRRKAACLIRSLDQSLRQPRKR